MVRTRKEILGILWLIQFPPVSDVKTKDQRRKWTPLRSAEEPQLEPGVLMTQVPAQAPGDALWTVMENHCYSGL